MTQLIRKNHTILLALTKQQKHMLWCLSVVYDTSMSDILRRILDRHIATIDVDDISASSLAMSQTQDEVVKGFTRLMNHNGIATHIVEHAKEQEWLQFEKGLERNVRTKNTTKGKDEKET